MIEIKPLKPIMTEEELDVEFDEEDVRVFEEEVENNYQVVVSGLNKNKEENGFYWRSSLFSIKEDAIAAACLLGMSHMTDLPEDTESCLAEVIEVCNGEDIETVFSIDFID